MIRLLKLTFLLAALSCSLFADFGDNVYFTYQIGGAIPSPYFSTVVSQTTQQIPNLALRTSGQGWLQASLSTTTTPSTLTISANPAGLAAGSYSASVEVWSPNMSNTLDYVVSLTVTPAPPPLTASPASLTFNAIQGSAPPAPQSLQLGASLSSGTAIFSTAIPTPLPSWLMVNNMRSIFWVGIFNAPATLQFSVDPSFTNLAPGAYTVSIKFYTILPDRQVTVTITLNVSAPPPVLKTNVNQVQFFYTAGDSAALPPQTIQVTSSGTPLSASVSLNAAWLSASTLSGTTPFNVDIKVSPTGLAVGKYQGQVVIATPPFSSAASSQTVNVTLNIAADTRPGITSVANGASFKPTISPGAWVTITGKNFSTSTAQATSAWLPTSLNGVSVQLSGVGGAYSLLLNYVNPTQINAFVPYEVTPMMFGTKGSAQITVTTSTGTASYSVDCEPISPALFVVNGYAAGIVYPNYSVVGTAAGMSTVSPGSLVSVYGTGFGQTMPTASNINGPVSPIPLATTPTVTIGGVPTNVLWAGMVGIGLYQFNIRVPTILLPGDYPVVMEIGGVSSPGAPLPVR